MARNIARALTLPELRNVAFWSGILFMAVENELPITFDYVKDNGEQSERVGYRAVDIAGHDSTLSVVTLDAQDNVRTFNVRGMQVGEWWEADAATHPEHYAY